LCDALLKAGDWITAQQMIKKLPDQSVLVHEPIAKTLCQLIHVVIEPIYRLKCATPYNIKGRRVTPHKSKLAPPAVTTMAKLRIHAFPMLTALGPSLHYDPILLYKLIRLMRVVLTDMNADPMNPPKNGAENESLYYDCMTMLDSAVLPALSYMDCNCCIAEEIWSVIKFYPYQYRCVCLCKRNKNNVRIKNQPVSLLLQIQFVCALEERYVHDATATDKTSRNCPKADQSPYEAGEQREY
jgi:THO complex subunit 2